ncbi:MAG: hypothetical protein SV375_10915, partial [Thermodesulfobacteriota bacterium]|nr:hypothetical protein [Thermodesulfobacteriota bacterium]
LMALQPDDVITINDTDYGGSYPVLVDSVRFNYAPEPNARFDIDFACIRFSDTLDDWSDLSPGAISIATDDTTYVWEPLFGGPGEEGLSLDDIADGFTYARILASALSSGAVLLSEALGDLDNIANGTTYGKVLLSDLSGGHIILGNCTGDLDDVADGSTYGRVLLTDISAGHIKLSECTGDLDDIADGTYGKVLTTDISAGHVLLASCTGDLDDVSNGTTYGKILLTDISAGHILLSECTGDLDDVADGTVYGKVKGTDISAGHILLSECSGDLTDISGDLDDISNGTTYAKVLATDISAGHIKLSECTGDLDDIANGTYGKVLTTAISAGKIQLTAGAGVTGSLSVSYTDADVTADNAQDLDWIDGTSGTLTLSSSGKLEINAAGALEIQAAGNIKVLAGADIEMIGSDTNPALIHFNPSTGTSIFFGCFSSVDRLCLYPETTETGSFYIGYDVTTPAEYASWHPFKNFLAGAESHMKFEVHDTGGSTQVSRLDMYCGASNNYVELIGTDSGKFGKIYFYSDGSAPYVETEAHYSVTQYCTAKVRAASGTPSFKVQAYNGATRYSEVYSANDGTTPEARLTAQYDSNNYSYMRTYAKSTYGGHVLVFVDGGVGRSLYIFANEIRMSTDMTVDIGQADKAFDDIYADDFHNEADYYFLDDRDDLAAICAIKGSGEYDPATGFELIDDSTLAPWMLARHSKDRQDIDPETEEVLASHKAGDIEYSSRGKPLLSQKVNLSLTWGALRQVDARLTALEAALAALQ